MNIAKILNLKNILSTLGTMSLLSLASIGQAQTISVTITPGASYKATWGNPGPTDIPFDYVKVAVDGLANAVVVPGGTNAREYVLPASASAPGPNGAAATHEVIAYPCKTNPAPQADSCNANDPILMIRLSTQPSKLNNLVIIAVPPPED